MAKIKNNFLKATVNKDFDERLTPNGQMTDAENVMVISEDGGGVGVLKNVKGNVKVTSLNIAGSETIGSIDDDASNRCFYFVTSTGYDYVIQFNLSDNTTEIVLQSTHGTGVLNFDSAYRISHSDIFVSVEGEDLLSWTDGLNPPRIINIERAKTYGIDGFTDREISVMKPSPIFAPNVVSVQSTSEDFAGFIRDKFLTFAYRYKYEDGYYSAFSSWSPYVFIPGSFQVDLDTSTNLGMQNNSRAYSINFNTGPRDVTDVELVFKISNSSTVYSIIKLNKAEEGWSNNFNNTFLFNNYKVYNVIPEAEYFRSFDNVPLLSHTQAKIGNRLVYGNYLEGRDIDSEIDFSVSFDSSEVGTSLNTDTQIVDGYTVTNLVDFWGTSDMYPTINSGIDISMDFENNIITLTNSTVDVKYARVILDIEKEPEYSEYGFDITVDFWGNQVTGSVVENVTTQQITLLPTLSPINPGESKEIRVYTDSLTPVLFKTNILVKIVDVGSFTYSQQSYDTDNYYQFTYTSDGQVPRKKINIDFTEASFSRESQMSFEFDLRTAFSPNDVYPSVDSFYTFVYDVSDDYSDFEDFITNSNFISELESFFFRVLSSAESNIPGASVIGFSLLVTSSDFINSILTITIPNRTITIEETGNNGVDVEKIDYVLCNSVTLSYSSNTLFTSIHSSRDYEIGIVFLDKEGRKTTVIDSKSNGTYIPSVNSVTQNVLKVNTIGNPPSWAEYYKFAVKYNRSKYETIYASRIYNVGVFSYIELVADNKNKVKEGDYLVIKSDLAGPLDDLINVKVLESRFFDKDEIETDSAAGFYFKIKIGNFDLTISDQDNYEFLGPAKAYKNPYYVESAKVEEPLGTPLPIEPGYRVRFVSYCNRRDRFDNKMDATYISSQSYADFRAFFEDVIEPSSQFQAYRFGDTEIFYQWTEGGASRTQISFRPDAGYSARRIRTKTDIYITTSSIPVFETTPIEGSNNTYIETPKTYRVVNGQYQFTEHRLTDLFNCYCFGNGVESISVRDEMNTNFLSIDYAVNAVSEDKYRQVHRFADLTYSGVYQESTGINKLNAFNLSLANYKDDLEKKYGKIVKLDSDATDLLVIQEDKWSKVLYGKDLLYNADATTNLSRIEDVLGQQVMYGGEYGISTFADSYREYATNSFATDTKRGVVLRYNESNGLSEISAFGMKEYFKTLFRDNQILNTIGGYDPFYDLYVLNIKYKIPGKDYTSLPVKYDYVTWTFSDDAQGFLGKQSFDPDSMLKVNNEFLSFKGADVYKHNIGAYNNFYGTPNSSYFEFNFNEEPSTRKIFKNISIEGNMSWDTTLRTEMQNGIIYASDYVNKEEIQYAYIRGNDSLDFSTISVFGLGEVQSISGSDYTLSEIPNQLSVGDTIHIATGAVFGTVSAIGSDFVTISVVPGLPFVVGVGTFLLASKPSNIETSGIRGYYMNCRMELNTTGYAEVFAVNSEVAKSFE